MGLLDNLAESPLFNVGMGLLANSGPSRNPVNPWGGVMQGLLSARQARQERVMMEREAAMQQAAQYKMQQDMERDAALKRWGQQYDAQNPGAIASEVPDLYLNAQITRDAERAKAITSEWTTAGALGLPGVDPNLPVEQKKNAFGQVVEQNLGNAALVQPNTPSDVREYEYAKKQGYGGTYEQWVMSKGAANAPKIDMGGTDLVNVQEAATLRYQDGTPVAPGTPWSEARAKGVRVATRADLKVEEMEAKQAAAMEKSGGPVDDYQAAAEAWRKNPTSTEALGTLQQERMRLAQILAQTNNPGRAPTDADVEIAMNSIPVPWGAMSAVASVEGGDPFAARMAVLAKEMGGEPRKKSTAEKTPTNPLFQKYPFLKDAP